MKIKFEKPTDEEELEAFQNGMRWKAIYHQGKLNHWKLITIPIKKDCGCRKI